MAAVSATLNDLYETF